VTDKDDKPVLNEQTFHKLLEAAHVLQEHTRRARELEGRREQHSERLRQQELADQAVLPRSPAAQPEAARPADYTVTLAEIVEVQRQIQARHLELEKAMAVVAEKVVHIAKASGAAVGILEGKMVRYRAGCGSPALPDGTEVPLKAAVCAASIRTGQVIRSEDVNTEVLFDPEPCRQRGILSLLAVPIYHDGDIVGALELYFDRLNGYAEQDIHTCRLLAGLVTEAISRDAELTLKKSMAAERSSMLAAIEKLQPNLAALAGDQPTVINQSAPAAPVATANFACWRCGGNLEAEEQFCGACGAPRVSDSETSSMQSKLASAWHMQQAIHEPSTAPANGTPPSEQHALDTNLHIETQAASKSHPDDLASIQAALDLAEPFSPRQPEPLSLPELHAEANEAVTAPKLTAPANEDALIDPFQAEPPDGEQPSDSAAPAPAASHEAVWTSAAKTRDFLESLNGKNKISALAAFWQSRRGDFYLAIAVILVLVVIRWGLWSNHPVAATGHGVTPAPSAAHEQPAPQPELSTLDKILISLGLAKAPEPPESKGNPDIPVWVDLHTALYYCPGSDLYGKTPKGKIASQRDAQLDQFEPANRKPCE